MAPGEIELVIRRLICLGCPRVFCQQHECDFVEIEVATNSPLTFLGFFITEGFVLLVLMTSWLTSLDRDERPLEILELFAGQARITRLAKQLGIPAEAHD